MKVTTDDILGKKCRTIQPRAAPHGYQVKQWECNEQAFKEAKIKNPALEYRSFMTGWNAAFSVIYKSK